jgi:hypothetical protein
MKSGGDWVSGLSRGDLNHFGLCSGDCPVAYKRARSSPAKVTRLAPRGFDLDDRAGGDPHTPLKD